MPRFGVDTEYVDATSLSEVTRAVGQKACRILYVETPANPNLALADIRALATIAHNSNCLLFVDSTFASPALQKPLELGADLVLHSATKLLAGHGDVLAGVAAGKQSLIANIRKEGVRTMGAVLAPASAAMVERGLSTLHVRVARASENALELAQRLSEHRAVARVHYPGLASHPQHTLACSQMHGGFGPVLSFELRDGYEGGVRLYDRVQIISRAVSLGDVRSLITHPASTTSASLPREQRIAAGISDGLLRLSVGLEHVEDVWEDLHQAMEA